MLADVIVAAVTWAITRAEYLRGRDVLRSTGKTTTFMGVLYKNGIVYFAALSIINVFHAAIYALEWTPQPAFSIYASRLTLSLAADASYTTSTAFLVSHFLVRLQEAARCLEEHASTPSIRGSRRSSVLEFVRADVDSATAESELDGYVHSSYDSSTDSARRHGSPEANRDPDGVEAMCMTVGCG
ncbi:hypothetical protein BC628DRAFT_1150209 [Trametes gibbosa]|nr:hypothetical protein BC628DRAFT_1150209 [Trametes gibbosa]